MQQRTRPLLTRLLRPTRQERLRMLNSEAWVCVLASYVLTLFAYLWPADFRNQAPAYVAVAWSRS